MSVVTDTTNHSNRLSAAERRALRAEAPGSKAAADLVASGALDGLFARIDAGEIDLAGDGGFIPGLIKAALERGTQVELTDHLGYEKGDPHASAFPNSRNGTTPKTVATQVGDVDLDLPRDRLGTFEPRLVPKGTRRLNELDEMIIALYAGGMTVRDIEYFLRSTLGTELSHETISKITDTVADEVLAWQQRALDALYPVIYLDAIMVKVRDGAHVTNKAAHLAVGVDMDGIKHVLGIWLQTTEGAKFWAGVCADLANRGIRDVLIVCCDGLVGLPEAIEATWNEATVQTCVVHLIRAAMRFVGYQDRKAVAAALKPIYTASDAKAARSELDAFADGQWGKKYPHAVTRVPQLVGIRAGLSEHRCLSTRFGGSGTAENGGHTNCRVGLVFTAGDAVEWWACTCGPRNGGTRTAASSGTCRWRTTGRSTASPTPKSC